MKKAYPARISIGRVHGGDEEKPIRIEIENAKTKKRFTEIHMSLTDFSEALLGRAACEGTGYIFTKDRPIKKGK